MTVVFVRRPLCILLAAAALAGCGGGDTGAPLADLGSGLSLRADGSVAGAGPLPASPGFEQRMLDQGAVR